MFSIIMCSRDDRRFATASAHYASLFAGVENEIIRIADARSMCEGYNRGVRQSRGDVLIFSHDDVEFLCANMPALLTKRLEQFDMLGIAGTTKLVGPRWVQAGLPYTIGQVGHVDPEGNGYLVMIWAAADRAVGNIAAMDGLFWCAKRELVEKVGFDEQTFTSFHLYDLDFTFRASQRGYKLAVCTDLFPIHASLGGFGDPNWQASAKAFMNKHGRWLASIPKRECTFGWLRVASRAECVKVMTPPWWT